MTDRQGQMTDTPEPQETRQERKPKVYCHLAPGAKTTTCGKPRVRGTTMPEWNHVECEACIRVRFNGELPAPYSSPREPQKDETLREKVLPRAMKVVEAIKRDLVPDLDENDGGQILVWLRDFGIECAGLKSEPRDPHACTLEEGCRCRACQREPHAALIAEAAKAAFEMECLFNELGGGNFDVKHAADVLRRCERALKGD